MNYLYKVLQKYVEVSYFAIQLDESIDVSNCVILRFMRCMG